MRLWSVRDCNIENVVRLYDYDLESKPALYGL